MRVVCSFTHKLKSSEQVEPQIKQKNKTELDHLTEWEIWWRADTDREVFKFYTDREATKIWRHRRLAKSSNRSQTSLAVA